MSMQWEGYQLDQLQRGITIGNCMPWRESVTDESQASKHYFPGASLNPVCICAGLKRLFQRGFWFTLWRLAVTALPGYRFIITAGLISTAGQAATIKQDLECGAHCAARHAGTPAVNAGRVTCLAVRLITLWLRALKKHYNLSHCRLNVTHF